MMDREDHPPWQLPNCVISDIRMPGSIDGVQLLELICRSPPMAAAAAVKNVGKVAAAKAPRKKRGRPKKGETGNMYVVKDDFELLDDTVVGEHAARNQRITTPTYQALHYLDAI